MVARSVGGILTGIPPPEVVIGFSTYSMPQDGGHIFAPIILQHSPEGVCNTTPPVFFTFSVAKRNTAPL